MELEGKKIAFLGGSITEGTGATQTEKMYVEVFRKKLQTGRGIQLWHRRHKDFKAKE